MYQLSAKDAGSRSFLFAHDASTVRAVVDELVLGRQTVALVPT